jgi:Tol biopolymer transport system component
MSGQWAVANAIGRTVAITALGAAVFLAAGPASGSLAATCLSGTTTRVSIAGTTQANSASIAAAISRDGRYVTFASLASNLVPSDTNGRPDAFLADRTTGTVERVSVATGGAQGAGGGTALVAAPAPVSPDGRFVAFRSELTDLVPGDTNASTDVFLRDRQSGTTELVSVAASGGPADGASGEPAMSADGRFVAFTSTATNLAGTDTNLHGQDVFVRDRQTGTTVLASLGPDGAQLPAGANRPAITDDGRFVAFIGLNSGNAYVRDLQNGVTEIVTVSTAGVVANGSVTTLAMTPDGRYVVFSSTATNLVSGDTNGAMDVFVRDRVAGTTERVSLAQDGSAPSGGSDGPAISPDGRFVAFQSPAANLVAGDTNSVRDVFIRDRSRGTTTRASVSSAGVQGSGASSAPALSATSPAGGAGPLVTVAFESAARQLVSDKTSTVSDIFARDLSETETAAPTLTMAATTSPNADGWYRGNVTVSLAASGACGQPVITYTLTGAQTGSGTRVLAGSVTISAEGITAVTATAVDAAASSAPQTLKVRIDRTAPAVTYTIDPPGGSSAGPVTVTFIASDAVSGLADVPVDAGGVATIPVTVDPQVTSSVSRTFTDRAGNAVTTTVGVLPIAITASASPLANAAGRNNTDVEITFTASGGSTAARRITFQLTGAETRTGSLIADSAHVSVKTEGTTTVTYSATNAGFSTAPQTFDVRIDKTPPDVSYTIDPPGGSSSAPVTVTFTASDALSGLAGVPVDPSGIATVTITADPRVTGTVTRTFTDRAGNAPTVTADILPARGCLVGTTTRASVTAGGTQAHGASGAPSLSGDGRYIAFESDAADLVPGDTNGVTDIFVRDRLTGLTVRASVSSAGVQANGSSSQARMSPGGRYVTFASNASNLVPGDTNEKQDIFVRDLVTGSTTRVSVQSDETQFHSFSPNWESFTEPTIVGGDGRYVAFTGSPTSQYDFAHVMLHDRLTHITTTAGIAEGGGALRTTDPALSADGRYLAYVAGISSTSYDLLIRDLVGGTMTRVSHTIFGTDLSEPALSADGRYAAFNAKLGGTKVWVHDSVTGSTTIVATVDFAGGGHPAISADGRYIAFFSLATNLIPGDTNGKADVFIYDQQTAAMERVSVSSRGLQSDGGSYDPAISADGAIVAFRSDATNIGNGDTNAVADIYVRERLGTDPACLATPVTSSAAISTVPNAAGWNNADVTVTISAAGGSGGLQISYTLSGAQTGTSSVVGSTASVTVSAEGMTTLTYVAQDASGAKSGEQTLTIKLDKTPPAVTTTRTPAPNASGWNNTDVRVSFDATDARSGVDGEAGLDVLLTEEGAGQVAMATFTDLAGNSTTATATGINIDKTAPSIVVTRSPAGNANGWNNTDVTVRFDATDALSGIEGEASASVLITGEGAGQSATRTFSDKAGNSASASATSIKIDRTPPAVTGINADPSPVGVDPTTHQATTTLTATIADGLSGVASAEYRVGTSEAWLPLTGGTGTYSASLTLPVGVYDVYARGIDLAGNTSAEASTLVVAYDPDGGFVTGGGWITSPAGAYAADPTATGRATFGFVSRYLPGRQTPSGQTEFQFRAVGLNFHSEEYEWLVVAGARAQYKGTGTINGSGSYGFLLTAIDGQIQGGGGDDRFRIKIWGSGGIVYDNQQNAPDSADPTTALGGGSIVIHK